MIENNLRWVKCCATCKGVQDWEYNTYAYCNIIDEFVHNTKICDKYECDLIIIS